MVRTAIDQPNPDGNPLQRAAIFVPTSYGRTLLPRLTGLLTAAADLKDQLVSEGLDPERLDAETITDIRDAQSRPLPFRQIAFIDMKDLAALHRRVAPGGRC